MPFDSEVSKLQGEINQLEEEVETIEACIWWIKNGLDVPDEDKKITSLYRTHARLKDSLEHKELKLSMHRQRTKESGVKY